MRSRTIDGDEGGQFALEANPARNERDNVVLNDHGTAPENGGLPDLVRPG